VNRQREDTPARRVARVSETPIRRAQLGINRNRAAQPPPPFNGRRLLEFGDVGVARFRSVPLRPMLYGRTHAGGDTKTATWGGTCTLFYELTNPFVRRLIARPLPCSCASLAWDISWRNAFRGFRLRSQSLEARVYRSMLRLRCRGVGVTDTGIQTLAGNCASSRRYVGR
jgi:hypothetical protein